MKADAYTICGHLTIVYDELNLMSVGHNGGITWDRLQKIKNEVWGQESCAIEVYPPQGDVVNSRNMRHLWKLEAGDERPDLLGPPKGGEGPSLYDKLRLAWSEAESVFKEKT